MRRNNFTLADFIISKNKSEGFEVCNVSGPPGYEVITFKNAKGETRTVKFGFTPVKPKNYRITIIKAEENDKITEAMNKDYAYCVGPNYFGGPALCQNCNRHIPFSQEVHETLTWTMPQYDEKTASCPLYDPKFKRLQGTSSHNEYYELHRRKKI